MQQRHIVASGGTRTPANVNGDGIELLSLKTILESLVGDGEEITVGKCKLILDVFSLHSDSSLYDTSVIQPALLVSDGAINTATAGAATSDLDEILDAMTAGEYEMRLLGEPQLLRSRNVSDDGGLNLLKNVHITVDITGPIRKVAKRLIKSPVLATNPYTKIVMALKQGNAAQKIDYNVAMILDYVVRPRTARMI
jgi:hypothetical protein